MQFRRLFSYQDLHMHVRLYSEELITDDQRQWEIFDNFIFVKKKEKKNDMISFQAQ